MIARPGTTGHPARLFLYPMSDVVFRRTVETSFATLDGRSAGDEAMLAAVAAMLRPTYPLAIVVARPFTAGVAETRAWDAFRDDTSLDDELLRRARAGQPLAERQLHDRHSALAFAVAVCAHGVPSDRGGAPRAYLRGGVTSGDPTGTDIVDDAVAVAFHAVLTQDQGPLTVRIRVARAAWLAARAADGRSRRPVDVGSVAVHLARRHGLTIMEIADVLGAPPDEVRRHVTAGLQAIIVP